MNPPVQPYSIPASERVSKVKEQSTRSLLQKRASERSVDGHYQNKQIYGFARSLAFTKASERVQCVRYFTERSPYNTQEKITINSVRSRCKIK